MHRGRIKSAVCVFLLLLALPAAPGAHAQNDSRCFAETGFCIAGRMRHYWEQNGGLAVFGFPITAQQQEMIEGRSLNVQWFEHNRLELHPENAAPYDVLLGWLGVDRLWQQGRDWQRFPARAPIDGCRFFGETGHNVCGDLLAAWFAGGLELDGQIGTSAAESLALWGLPLSDVHSETLEDGRQYQVQWFERTRFELHPENNPPFRVLLGLLGSAVTGGAGSGPQPAPVPAPAASCNLNAAERQLALAMQQHPEQRRPALRCHPILARVARERAADMARRRYFSHINPDGYGANYLVQQAGYPLPDFYGSGTNTNTIESIGSGYQTAEDAWLGWMESSGHRTHLLGLDPFYAEQVEYGIGYVADPGSEYGYYWVVITARGP